MLPTSSPQAPASAYTESRRDNQPAEDILPEAARRAAMGGPAASAKLRHSAERPSSPQKTADASSNSSSESGQRKSAATDIDLDAALVPQVGKLGLEYWDWVHKPNSRPHYRLFPWDFVEKFSSTPWWLIPLVWVPVILFFFWRATRGSQGLDGHGLAATVLSGAGVWTFLEYFLHRFLFHAVFSASSPFWITTHFILHGQHHKFPMDQGRLVFPPVAAAILATPFYMLFRAALDQHMTDAVMAGALAGYVSYDMIHYYLHHGQPKASTYLGRLKAYHRAHHYKNHEKGEGGEVVFYLAEKGKGSMDCRERLRRGEGAWGRASGCPAGRF